MYKLAVKEGLDRKFKKLREKDRKTLLLIHKKVQQILDNPYRFKPLRKPLPAGRVCLYSFIPRGIGGQRPETVKKRKNPANPACP